MYCSRCNSYIEQGDIFCSKCGNPLKENNNSMNSEIVSNQYNKPQNKIVGTVENYNLNPNQNYDNRFNYVHNSSTNLQNNNYNNASVVNNQNIQSKNNVINNEVGHNYNTNQVYNDSFATSQSNQINNQSNYNGSQFLGNQYISKNDDEIDNKQHGLSKKNKIILLFSVLIISILVFGISKYYVNNIFNIDKHISSTVYYDGVVFPVYGNMKYEIDDTNLLKFTDNSTLIGIQKLDFIKPTILDFDISLIRSQINQIAYFDGTVNWQKKIYDNNIRVLSFELESNNQKAIGAITEIDGIIFQILISNNKNTFDYEYLDKVINNIFKEVK